MQQPTLCVVDALHVVRPASDPLSIDPLTDSATSTASARQTARVDEITGTPRSVSRDRRLPKQTREVLTRDIAEALNIRPPDISGGSSAETSFLDRIHAALTKADPVAGNAYRKTERILQHFGLTYDPFWDTSESSDTGGSTVTNRAYSRIRTAITGVPRCFLIRDFPLPGGDFQYHSRGEGRAMLTDAGPASRVLFWNSPHSGVSVLNAHGEVAYIEPGWSGPWLANFIDLRRIESTVSLSSFGLTALTPITEIAYETYRSLLDATDNSVLDQAIVDDPDPDPGGDTVAERVLTEIRPPGQPPLVDIPDRLPPGPIDLGPAIKPIYTESPNEGAPIASSDLPPRPQDRRKARAAEQRAVRLTRQALEVDGWDLKRDCQQDGIGYDLKYGRGARKLHVEVKGIMGPTLAFNLTPKEAWRAETDPDFVVVAVTNVLSPTAFQLHVLDRSRLASASRVITGYRLKF